MPLRPGQCPLWAKSGHWRSVSTFGLATGCANRSALGPPLRPGRRVDLVGMVPSEQHVVHYATVRLKLSVAVCAPGVVESVTITVKVAVALWVGVPDNTPALGDSPIPFGGAPFTTDHT